MPHPAPSAHPYLTTSRGACQVESSTTPEASPRAGRALRRPATALPIFPPPSGRRCPSRRRLHHAGRLARRSRTLRGCAGLCQGKPCLSLRSLK